MPNTITPTDFEGFGRAIFEYMHKSNFWSEESDDICEIAEKFRLVSREPFNPEAHNVEGGEFMDDGDMIWVLATIG